MRYYLDTQTLAQVVFNSDDISRDVRALLEDGENVFFTSSVCVMELTHLIQTGRIRPASKKRKYSAQETVKSIRSAEIEIRPTDILHLEQLAQLPLYEEHNDPNDRLIVAQAIRDRIPLISTDSKFSLYIVSGLELIENR